MSKQNHTIERKLELKHVISILDLETSNQFIEPHNGKRFRDKNM